jgi:hypothetical protein
MGYETTVQGPTPHRAVATHGVVRKRPDCPTMWGFNTPPLFGGVPPHPKGEGSNPSEIYPCPNISSGNYDIFVIDCPGWGYPPPPGSQYPPFLGGGRGGSKPPPGAWDCYGGYPPKRGGYPPPPGWVPKWVPGGGGPMSPRTIGQNRGRHSGVPPVPRAIA